MAVSIINVGCFMLCTLESDETHDFQTRCSSDALRFKKRVELVSCNIPISTMILPGGCILKMANAACSASLGFFRVYLYIYTYTYIYIYIESERVCVFVCVISKVATHSMQSRSNPTRQT